MQMREIIDIVEARTTLPLGRDATNVTYDGRQASLIVVMTPVDFLRLTTGSDTHYRNFLDNTPQQGRPDSLDAKDDADRYVMPYLFVDSNGKVTRHDGRHRAALVARAGGNRFPVAMIFADPTQTTLPPQLFSQFRKGNSVSTADMKAAPPKPLRPLRQPDIDPASQTKALAFLAQFERGKTA